MINFLINIIGWAGVALLIIAYGLVSTKRCQGNSTLYQTLNIIGALLLIINSFYFGAYPSVGVNVVWVGIGLFTLIKAIKNAKALPPAQGEERLKSQ
jgi:hypothetical protein